MYWGVLVRHYFGRELHRCVGLDVYSLLPCEERRLPGLDDVVAGRDMQGRSSLGVHCGGVGTDPDMWLAKAHRPGLVEHLDREPMLRGRDRCDAETVLRLPMQGGLTLWADAGSPPM